MLDSGAVIVGAGIDVVEVARVAAAIQRGGERLRTRLFTEREALDCEPRRRAAAHFAIRFAAKEAGMKAIGTGWRHGVAWRDFETIEGPDGLELRLSGRALEFARARGFARVWLGASFTRTHAIAQVVLESSGPDLSQS